ncbi:hypothetical protein [Bradyrhizobium diazoefficiens]
MSLSIGLIVDGYVKLNNRSALENLLAHRRELLAAAVELRYRH